MKQQITLSQYRNMDLGILAVLMAVSQFLISFAATRWFPLTEYVVSPVAAVVTLVMMRWNGWCAVHAVLGGLLYALLAGGSWEHYLIYGMGNLLVLAALPLFKVWDKETIRKSANKSLVLALCAQLLMQLGRAGVALVLGTAPAACLGFITTDALSIVFTLVIIWIVRRIEGLFEDQIHYLLRVESERQVEGRDQF